MDRRILWFLVGSLVAFPVLASNPSTVLSSVMLPEASSACAGPANEEPASAGVSYQPLSAEERISFGLAGLRKGILEARFLVDGNVYVLETFDLSKIELPRMVEVQEAKGQGIGPQARDRKVEARSLLKAEKVIELLAREPDIIRELHRLAAGGSRVEIETLHDGKIVERLSLDDSRGRTLKRNQVPVVADSTVTGPGMEQKPRPRLITANDYLPDCGDCDYGIPCETECGYDPGKGGPVTCQEQGLPCGDPPTCECETSHGEYWTAWWEYDRVPT
jgi:hypothetical protein